MKHLIFLSLLISVQLKAQNIALLIREKFAPVVKGKPSKVISYNGWYDAAKPAATSKQVTIYDSLSRPVSSETYDASGKLNHRRVFLYDSIHNRLLAVITSISHKEEMLVDTNFYFYDAKGFIVKQVNKFGDSSAVVEFTNNENGLPVSAISYDTKGRARMIEKAEYNLRKNTFTVNEQYQPGGKKREAVFKLDFTKPSRYQHRQNEKYDEYGNCIAWEKVLKNGKTEEYTAVFEYDHNGNWIRSVHYHMYPLTIGDKQLKTPESKRSRVIEYFE